MAPFLASAAGIGYETKAYVWVGYGVWTQLWAACTLPLAWGFTYRALSGRRGVSAFFAVLFIMLTVALHYETGYLAFVPLIVWPFLVPSDLLAATRAAVALGAAAALASAWVIVPVQVRHHSLCRRVSLVRRNSSIAGLLLGNHPGGDHSAAHRRANHTGRPNASKRTSRL